MKSILEIYVNRQRGPWIIPMMWESILGVRERAIIQSRACECFPHKLNKDCDFYLNDGCISYYCPENGEFTIDVKQHKIV